MTRIAREEILRIARLAELEFGPDELVRFASEFQTILDYLGQLERLDLAGVEPTAHSSREPQAGELPGRPDQPRPGLTTEEALREAPEKSREHFVVPRFVG